MKSDRERDFGRRLRELRDERGVSQRALADAIGLDQSAVHRMETGQRKIEVGELIAACDHLGVSIDRLLQPEQATIALRAAAPADDVHAAMREFQRVINDFFAFRAAAGR